MFKFWIVLITCCTWKAIDLDILRSDCAEKFQFENPAIEGKQCKQMEWFLATANESDYFLSLDDKSQQMYEAKIDNIQRYDLYQITKERTFRWD